MNIKSMFENSKQYCSYHKGEICGIGSALFSVAAVGFALFEGEKARKDISEAKAEFLRIREEYHDENGNVIDGYGRVIAKHTAKMVGRTAYNLKGTLLCEAASITLMAIGIKSLSKSRNAAVALATSALSTLALTESSVESLFGADGLAKVKAQRLQPLKTEVKRIDPATGEEISKEIVEEGPELEYLDYNAWKILKEQPAEVQAAHDPLSCVVIDDRNSNFTACNGNIDYMLPALKNALDNSNHRMWMKGKIYMEQMLSYLGFNDLDDGTFNRDLMEMLGTIDVPTAYDQVAKKYVRIKGFDEDGMVTNRPDYGEHSHKYLSYGADQDKYLFCRPEAGYDTHFIIDGKLFLDLSYDGNILQYRTGNVSVDRKRSAWVEEPIMEK